MKTFLFLFLIIGTAIAAEVKDFNRTLTEKMKKDVKEENIEQFKKASPSRGPASANDWVNEKGNEKLNKQFRQIGPNKW